MSDVVTPEDFQAILAQLRDWVRTKVVPREREIADADAIPDDLRKQAADMGLFGYAIPQEWGGLGLDLTQDVELAMELGYTSLAVRSMFGTNNGIAGQVLVNFGTDEQKAGWLGRLASGEVVASFALTEPGAGSNPAGLQTRAVPDGDDWVIDGQKRFITNAPSADLFVVFARTRPADESGTGIAVFLVPADTAGVEVGAKDRKMGQEGAWTSDVVFSDVRVPASALVGGDVDAGYRAAMTSLARGRVHMAALAVGTAQRALDESVGYAASATQGGTVIGDFQLVQAMIADQQTGVLAGRALVRETAARYVSGEDRRIGPSAAKLFCTEMAGQVADLAVQIHGGSGYMRDVPVERIYRDVRLLRLYEGTSEIQRLIIGGGLIRARQRRLRDRGRRPPGTNPPGQAGMFEGADDGVGAQVLAGEAGHAQGRQPGVAGGAQSGCRVLDRQGGVRAGAEAGAAEQIGVGGGFGAGGVLGGDDDAEHAVQPGPLECDVEQGLRRVADHRGRDRRGDQSRCLKGARPGQRVGGDALGDQVKQFAADGRRIAGLAEDPGYPVAPGGKCHAVEREFVRGSEGQAAGGEQLGLGVGPAGFGVHERPVAVERYSARDPPVEWPGLGDLGHGVLSGRRGRTGCSGRDVAREVAACWS
jgi:acyl-CoA dehydrogenase